MALLRNIIVTEREPHFILSVPESILNKLINSFFQTIQLEQEILFSE